MITLGRRQCHRVLIFRYNIESAQSKRIIKNVNKVKTLNNSKKPVGYWKNSKHVRDFFVYCSPKLNIKNPEDWYQISHNQIKSLGGNSLFYVYPKLVSALSVAYPEYKWIQCLFNKTPKGTWKDPHHLRDFFEYCSPKLNINNPEDWYKITHNQIKSLGGNSLYSFYPNLASALSVVYTDYKWIHCLFYRCPLGAWKDPQHLRDFFDHCSTKLNITQPEDWYKVTYNQIKTLGGDSLYKSYHNLAIAISIAYPEYKWIHCLFNKCPKGTLKNPQHLRDFFEYCSEKLNIKSPEDWYQVTYNQIQSLGGKPLYDIYPSLANALSVAYPNYNWIHCLFNKCPKGTWKDPQHLRDFFEHCKNVLEIENVEDWKRISRKQFSQLRGSYLFANGKNAGHYLRLAYPEYPPNVFNPIEFSARGKRAAQRWLIVQLSKLLPKGTKIIEEYQHPLCTWEDSHGKLIEFDVWVPDYNLAIEYQGEQHFYDISGLTGGSLSMNLTRDNMKKNIAQTQNINFVAIPYWWDGSVSSLNATLQHHFPHLFPININKMTN